MVSGIVAESWRPLADVATSMRGRSIRFLLYHRICDDEKDPFAIPPDLFRRQMEVLATARADDPKIRVQLVSKPASPTTGIGRYAQELAHGLVTTGVDLRSAPLRTLVPGSIADLGRRFGYDVEAFTRSYPARANLRPGYVTHLTSQTLASLLVTQRLPRPVVVTVHDILPYVLRDDPALRVYRHRMNQWMDRLAMRGLRRADRLIANSRYTKQTLIDVLAIGPESVDVVYLGVDTEHFRPQSIPEDFWRRYDLTAGGSYVLYVGSEDPRKDVPTLLRALADLRRGGLDVVLLKVGAPAFAEQRARHLCLCAELGIADAVRWFDEVSEEDLPRFYNAAGVFAFPSRYEGFGFPVLEALACGTPVVAARESSVPELVGDAARLIEPGSVPAFAAAIVDALATGKRDAHALVTQARRFTWEQTVRETHAVYVRLIQEKRRGS
jgi:glycosyltransferase involved in cell wall biosynthesis